MSQPEYLFNTMPRGDARSLRTTGRPIIVQADALGEGEGRVIRAAYPAIMRRTSSRTIDGIGTFHHAEPSGRHDRKVLRFDIHRTTGTGIPVVPATAAGVKSVVRRLRDREAAELDALDAEIELVTAVLHRLREDRKTTIRRAWANGNVVRLNEILEHVHEASY